MLPRKYPPTTWLFTDERMEDGLWRALARLPPGGGIVFRHHATHPSVRRVLLKRVRRIAAARRLVLVVAGGAPGAGVHGKAAGSGLRTWSAHDRRQAIAGRVAGAAVLFVSPVFATRSHPGSRALGPLKAARIAATVPASLIALGGMTERRFRRIRQLGFDGWAAIDAWTDQKRKAVPT